jgi:hypothetical protein
MLKFKSSPIRHPETDWKSSSGFPRSRNHYWVIISGYNAGNTFSIIYLLISRSFMYKIALTRYLNRHSFYSVDEYLLSKKWLIHFFVPWCSLWRIGIRETLVSFQFLDFRQSVGRPGLEINPSQGRYLHTGQHKHRINVHTKHQCLKWDSNPRSKRPSERRQFMPQTVRLPWPATRPFRGCVISRSWQYWCTCMLMYF